MASWEGAVIVLRVVKALASQMTPDQMRAAAKDLRAQAAAEASARDRDFLETTAGALEELSVATLEQADQSI